MCHCGTCSPDTADNMDNNFMNRLVYLRETCGFPFIVTSAYRCPDYNNKISSTGLTGPHTTGRAVDIAVQGMEQSALIKLAIAQGFEGVGIRAHGPREDRFVHLDLGIASRKGRLIIFTYQQKEKKAKL